MVATGEGQTPNGNNDSTKDENSRGVDKNAPDENKNDSGVNKNNSSNVNSKEDSGDNNEKEPETYSKDYVATLRQENARYRTRAETLDTDLAQTKTKLIELERAQMSDQQRKDSELAELRETKIPDLEERTRDLTVKYLSVKLDIVDPEVAGKFLDWKTLDVRNTQAVEDALKQLLKDKPFLAGANQRANDNKDAEADAKSDEKNADAKKSKASTSVGQPKDTQGKPQTTFSRAKLRTMSPDDLNDLYENGGLAEALAEGRVTD